MNVHTIVIIWVMKIFLYTSPVYCCHLFLISSACLRSKPFLWFRNFEEISSLSHSIVFFYFFTLITEEEFPICMLFFGILHSNGYIFPFLRCLSLLFFSQLFVRLPQTTILPFCIFWNNRLVPNQERSTSRLHIVTLLI